MTGEQPDWLLKVREEAQGIGQVLFANFKHAMELCVKHAPDQLDVQQRARVFETLVQAWLGGAIIPIATFANTTKEIEDMVVQEIRNKFEWIRRNEKELAMARLGQMAEARKEKSGLVILPGANADSK